MAEKTAMSAELAEQEFNDWAESMGLEVGADNSRSEDDELVLASGKRLFVRAVTKGNAIVNDEGIFVYTVSRLSPEGYGGTDVEITMPPPRSFVNGGKKGTDGMQRVLNVASGMTGKDTGWLLNLALPDFKFFMGIAGLFLLG